MSSHKWVASPTKSAGLSLRSEEEDVDMLAEEDDDELAISMASLAFDEEVSSRLLDRTARLQRQGVTSYRPEDPSAIFVQVMRPVWSLYGYAYEVVAPTSGPILLFSFSFTSAGSICRSISPTDPPIYGTQTPGFA